MLLAQVDYRARFLIHYFPHGATLGRGEFSGAVQRAQVQEHTTVVSGASA